MAAIPGRWISFLPLSQDGSPRPKAKKFNYPNGDTAAIIEQALADYAGMLGTTVSDVIVSILTEALLPKNPHASQISALAFRDAGGNAIKACLARLFAEEAAGRDHRSSHAGESNFELVRFCSFYFSAHHATLPQSSFIEGTLDWRSESKPAIESFRAMLGPIDDKVNAEEDLTQRETEAHESGAYIYSQLGKNQNFELAVAVDFIIEEWEFFGNDTSTYRFLARAARLASMNGEDTGSERISFMSSLEATFEAWAREDETALKASQSDIDDRLFATIPIANGDSARIPSSWILANPQDAKDAKAVHVVTARNAGPNQPFIVYFSDCTGEDDESSALAAARSVDQGISRIEDRQTEIEYNKDGGVANRNDYLNSPRISIFRLYPRDCYPNRQAPFGACIIRNEAERSPCQK